MQLNISVVKILVLAISVSSVACGDKQELASNQPGLEEIPDQEGWDATLTTTRDGMTTSKITYVHMQNYSKKQLIRFLQGVNIELYDSNGERTSTIHAEEAELDQRSKRIDMSGNVRVQAEDGLILRTEKLTWTELEAKILSDEFVTVVTAENDTINGVGFESDKLLKSWVIKKPWGVTQQNLNL